MSSAKGGEVGVPLKVLHEARGTRVTVETDAGDTFSGTLEAIEDNMNLELSAATHTKKTGRERTLPSIYIRGSSVVFFVVDDKLKHCLAVVDAPAATRGQPAGRGHGKFGAGGGGGGGGGRGGGVGAAGGKRKRDGSD